MTINERLFSIMKDRKISIRELSRMTGITASTISDWNTKHTNPSADKIMVLCEALCVTPSFFLSGEEEKQQDYSLSEDEIKLIEYYRNINSNQQKRLAAYMSRLKDMKER